MEMSLLLVNQNIYEVLIDILHNSELRYALCVLPKLSKDAQHLCISALIASGNKMTS